MLCLSCFPLPAPRVPRCVWRAVLSGCSLPLLAGTPFHAVCAFRELGLVALLVVPACPLRVCALALPRRPPPPPPRVVWCAHPARSRHRALVGPFHVVRAPPRVLPPSLAPSGVLGEARSGSGSPLLGLGLWGLRNGVPGGAAFHCCEGRLRSGAPPPPTALQLGVLLGSATHVLPARACRCGGPTLSPWPARSVGAACRGGGGGPSPHLAWGCAPPVGQVRGVRVPGGGLGGGEGGACAAPPVCAAGGACRAGGRSASFRPSAFPGQATKRVSLASLWLWGAWSPYHSGSCSPAFTGRNLCGVLARWLGLACSPRFLWEPAAGAGGWAVLQLLSRAGAGGTIPPASRGGGRGPRNLLAGGGGGGGGRAVASLLPLRGAARGSLAWPPSCHQRTPSRRARSVGVAGPPRGGGDEGRPVDRFPGGPLRPEPPLCPPRVGNGHGGGSWGARPQYCSGAPPCAFPRLGPRAAPARWCGLVRQPRPPREQAAGGAGARGVQVQLHPPPPLCGPFWGRGGVPSAPGGRRIAPVALKAWGGERVGGLGGRPTAPRPPAPSGVGLPSVVSGVPLRGILVPWGLPGSRGRRARPGRPPMGQCGRGGGRGGGTPLPWFAPPSSPGRPPKGPLRVRRPGRCHSAVGRQQAGRERSGGSPRALAAAAVPPQPGCSGLFGGDAGPPSLRSAYVRSWACGGGGGGWRGPSGPLVPPPDGRGGVAWWSRPRGPAVGWGVALFPRPPLPRAGPSCRPWLGPLVPPAVVARRWPAGGGREG